MPNNARSEKTKEALKMSLLDLLSRKNLDEITVKELCDLAGIQRGTFYWHYRNTAELFDEIKNDDVNAILSFHDIRNKVALNVDSVREYLTFIKDKKTFLFIEYKDLDEFAQFKDLYKDKCLEIFANSLDIDLSDEASYNAVCFMFAGIYEYLLQWIKSDYRASVDDVAEHIFILIESIARTINPQNYR